MIRSCSVPIATPFIWLFAVVPTRFLWLRVGPQILKHPLTTWIKVGDGRPPGVLLESVEGGETLGRWSVIACDPLWTSSARNDRLTRTWRDGHKETFNGNPFESLRDCLAPYSLSLIHI